MNSCEKYWRIMDHPAFINKDFVGIEISIDPHMVCKETNKIEDYKKLNTTLQLWIEVLVPYYNDDTKQFESEHNWMLDCGGFTWEEAIDTLYDLVLIEYGDYTKEDRTLKMDEVYKIKQSTVFAPTRLFKASVNFTDKPKKWSNDLLDDEQLSVLNDETMVATLKTIQALTNYRNTCSINEYPDVDSELEKEHFHLFEQRLSIEHKIDLVKK